MADDTSTDGTERFARQDILDSADESNRKRRGVLRGAVGAVAAAVGVSGVAAGSERGRGSTSDLASVVGTGDGQRGIDPQPTTFCTYECIDGTCGCREYYIDEYRGACFDNGNWCCLEGQCSCDETCPY